jgi:hypothetical protein
MSNKIKLRKGKSKMYQLVGPWICIIFHVSSICLEMSLY